MPDYAFIAQPPQNNSLRSISDLMGIATQAQGLQRGAVDLTLARELLNSSIERGKAESRVAQETAQPRIDTATATAQSAQTESKARSFALQREQATAALNEAAGLFRDPRITGNDPAGTIDALVEARKRMVAKGIPEHVAEGLTAELISKAGQPGAVLNQLHGITQANAGPGGQAGVINAPLSSVSTGQETQFRQLQPGAPGAVPNGSAVQIQLPPTTPVFNPQTNTPGYLGPQSAPRPVQSGPALGVAENVGGTVDAVNKDWATTLSSAEKAQRDVGILQEIKKYAPGAVTGVVGDRRSFIAGLAGLVGMDAGEIARTDTDLLAKNASMLALAGGDTNLGKMLGEMSNPNVHMTKEAIVKAANQVIAQRQMAVVKQNYLGQFKNDPAAYTNALARFNSVADPRVLQFESMTPQERVAMKAAMSPQEQKSFGNKLRAMYDMGIFK